MVDNSELSDEQTSERPDIERYFSLVRRRHMHFLIPLLFGWLIVWGAGWILPPRYQSATLILVEQPSMPRDYVAPNVSEDLQDRLQSISQQILSRTRLLSIIDRLHLYAEGHTKATEDEKVESMRKDIDIELVHSDNQKEITGFTINYTARDPQIAQQVTGELTDLFIDENLKARQQESVNTTSFIESQLQAAGAVLAEQEVKVREYQSKHQGELPSQQASNLQILGGLQSQLQNQQDALNSARQQGIYLQALIEQYRALSAAQVTPDGTLAPAPTSLPAIDQQLGSLRSKLANLSAHYTDRYPDVQSLKSEIAKTEKMRDDLIAGLKVKDKSDDQASGAAPMNDRKDHAQNPATLQIESQLQANKMELGNREQAIAALQTRVSAYQVRLSNEPVREQELADLNRGYDQSKAHYDELLRKRNESAMATSMEQMQQGERFRVLDPPSLPLKPDFPNRLKLCGIGIGAGLLLGFIVAGGFELLDGRLHTEEEIKQLLPIEVISEIPVISIPADEKLRKRRTALGWAMAVLVASVILAGSAFSYLHG